MKLRNFMRLASLLLAAALLLSRAIPRLFTTIMRSSIQALFPKIRSGRTTTPLKPMTRRLR